MAHAGSTGMSHTLTAPSAPLPVSRPQDVSVKVALSFPRGGTHFLWSRYVQSGRYQLIYDADRVPALSVLAERCDEPLTFLLQPPANPNYNFQYNSLERLAAPLPAAGHLEALARRYGCSSDPRALFLAIMARQDAGQRTLLSVNRFIYTTRQGFLFDRDCYGVGDALTGLSRYVAWLRAGGYAASGWLVARDIASWVRSHAEYYEPADAGRILERLDDLPQVLSACGPLGFPIYDMNDVIACIKGGHLEFEGAVSPLNAAAAGRLATEAAATALRLRERAQARGALVRVRRLWQYLREADPVLRVSLVRSIGRGLLRVPPWVPFLGPRVSADQEGAALNNARIR